ncbi:MAG: outer membrane protein assembly factor BamA [Alphaproteobacteria bacterium]
MSHLQTNTRAPFARSPRVKSAVIVTVILTLALSLTPSPKIASAQTIQSGGTIEAFQVLGNQRVEAESVIARLGIFEGDPFDPDLLDNAFKTLFDTNLFKDVTFAREGNILVITVEENPILSQIAFEGNERLTDEVLSSEIPLRERDVYTPANVRRALDRLELIYQRRGFYEVRINPQIIERDQNRVDLVFEITEGRPVQILSIDFIGNENFSDSRLTRIITTKRRAWFRFFSSADIYDPERLDFDRELLRRFYSGEGYPEFQVVSATAEYLPTRAGFAITFVIEEGLLYTFGNVEITSESGDISVEPLLGIIETKTNDTYDAGLIEEDQNAIRDQIAADGFAFVTVNEQINLQRNSQKVDIIFSIAEGREVYVERIDIEGNLRTLDKVVRREFRLSEGSPYDRAAVRRSQQKIRNLGYFRQVNVSEEPASEDDQVILKTQVEEQPTGGLFFGLSYASDSAFSGQVTLNEDNLVGTGRRVALGTRIGGDFSEIDLSYTQPYFLDRPLLVGGDVFRIRNQFESDGYDRTRIGFALRGGYDLSEFTRHVLRYSLRSNEISITGKPPASIQQEVNEDGNRTLRSSISQTIIYDRRDSSINPTEGHFVELFNDFTGIGGDIRYIRSTLSSAKFFPVRRNRARPTRVVFQMRGELGHINGIGQDSTASDRFYLGGRSFRGFDFFGIGPREVTSRRAIGGKYYYKGTARLDFPLGLPEEVDILGFAFTNFGSLFGYDTKAVEDDPDPDAPADKMIPLRVHDEKSVRVAIGGGFFWRSPLGPLSLSWSRAVQKESYDVSQNFLFTIGSEF